MIRRMLGGKAEERERWNEWLKSKEADEYLGMAEVPIFAYLTEGEFRIRRAQCGSMPTECTMPETRGFAVIPSKPVAPADFIAPTVLPPGLATVIRPWLCPTEWIGLADVSVDAAGRVTKVDLTKMSQLPPCASKMLATILRLSLAVPETILSPMKSEFDQSCRRPIPSSTAPRSKPSRIGRSSRPLATASRST